MQNEICFNIYHIIYFIKVYRDKNIFIKSVLKIAQQLTIHKNRDKNENN